MKIGYRENIETWEADSPKLYQFRRGIEEMQKISEQALMDERGYQWCAGVHGGFGGEPYCEHQSENFLGWHRPYLLDFEIKIRERIKDIFGVAAAEEWRIPYWNWASRTTTGIPKAFTDETYMDGETEKPNPLYSQPYQLPYPPGLPLPNEGWPTQTYREPGNVDEPSPGQPALRDLRTQVLAAWEINTFGEDGFCLAIEQPHNGLHVWVGGFMVTLRSSFDPIFWCHHANVDRQWWIWQRKYGNSTVPQAQRDFICRPFRFIDNRAEAFFDTRRLGYEYTDYEMNVHPDIIRIQAAETEKTDQPDTLRINIGSLKRDFDDAKLQLLGVRHTEETYQIRVFANNPSADANTLTKPRAGYLGVLTILGHGHCPGAPGHCDVRTTSQFSGDLRTPHHLAPFNLNLNITNSLQKFIKAKQRQAKKGKTVDTNKTKVKTKQKKNQRKKIKTVDLDNIHLSLVVIGIDGKQRQGSVVKFDRLKVSVD